METISHSLLTFLLNSLWQVTLAAAAAVPVCLLMRNGPASHRYAVWVAALVAALFLPLASIGPGEQSKSPRYEVTYSPQAATNLPSGVLPPLAGQSRMGKAAIRTVSLAQTTITLSLAAYVLFLVFRFWKLARAWTRTVQIRREAHEITDVPPAMQSVWVRCVEVFAQRHVELLASSHITSPVAVGWVRKTIILPDCLLAETSTDVLSAAIGHEMAHMARHDFLLSLVYELLYLPLSFHPAAWIVRRGIAQTREMACDELVTRLLLDADVYARSIVSIATTMKGLARPGYALGVFDADNLEERVRRLVKRTPVNLKRARLLLATSLSALAICVAIASGVSFTARAQGASYGEMKLAQEAYKSGDFQEAVLHFENAVKSEPSNVKPKLFLANALLQQLSSEKNEPGNTLMARAREQYKDVLALDANNQAAARGMMAIAMDAKQTSEARQWALQLIRIDPTDKGAYYTAGVVDWATVYPEFERAKQAAGVRVEDYSIPDANVRRTLREAYLPQIEDGFRMLQAALQIDPGYDDAMAYINLLCRLKAGLVDSPAESADLMAKADQWVGNALATKRARANGPKPGPATIDVDGPPPGPESLSRRVAAPPPPPPPPIGSAGNQVASPLPPVKPRNAEAPSPYWQVTGRADAPAMALFHELESKGFRAALFRAREDDLVRVMVGPYFDQQSLERAKGEIEAAGFHALRIW
jgi:beta-lactamase regulating signal transducer with metallopeptidase domain/cell division septation protein DedD